MGIRLRIKYKILLLVLSVAILIYVVSLGYVVSSARNVMLHDAYETATLSTQDAAGDVTAVFERYVSVVRTAALAFQDFPQQKEQEWLERNPKILLEIFRAYPELIAIWDSYEYYAYKPGYDKPYGRISTQVFQLPDGSITANHLELSQTGDPAVYKAFKLANSPGIFEPYLDVLSLSESNHVLMTTVAAPIQDDKERYIGMVGVDISLTWLQDKIASIRPFERSEAFLLTNQGTIAAHPNDAMLKQTARDMFGDVVDREDILKKIKQGKSHSFIYVTDDGERSFVYLAPVRVAGAYTNWSLGVIVPLSVITATADNSVKAAILVGLLLLSVLVFVLLFVAERVTRPIVRVTKTFAHLAQGETNEGLKVYIKSGDEIEEMTQALNRFIDGLEQKNELAYAIGKGNLDLDVPLLSDRDTLGIALAQMRNGLREAAQLERQRKEESQNREWANVGMVRVSEILRENSENLDVLCERVLRYLVRYVRGNQAGLYMLDTSTVEENNSSLLSREFYLKSSYAWGRIRYLEARFKMGEGLVGACAMEGKPIYITDVPKDYSRILAGVGESLPRCIVLVPLMHAGEAIGVIEIASFNLMPTFELEFLESVSQAIASSLFSVQTRERTKMLLEQSHEQAEQLQAQEEELRQNLEELTSAQEESTRQMMESEALVRALARSLFYVEYDPRGYVIGISENYLQRIGRTREMLVGTYFAECLIVGDWGKTQFDLFWNEVRQGHTKRLRVYTDEGVEPMMLIEFYIPILDNLQQVTKVIKLSFEEKER